MVSYEHRQEELVKLLSDAGVSHGLMDQNPKGQSIPLTEIDPFTFLSLAYKYRDSTNLEILSKLKEGLGLKEDLPSDFNGIPSVQAQSAWLFPYKYERNPDDIPALWKLFIEASSDRVTEATFDRAVNVKHVGISKLTQRLFHYFPNNYLPIDSQTSDYIRSKGLDPNCKTFSDYKQILETIKTSDSRPFYVVSRDCWLENQEKSNQNINYWVFQGNPNVYDFEKGIRENIIDVWTVSAHRDKIKKGDKVILWITGKQAGCYALAETTGDPRKRGSQEQTSDELWKEENPSEYAVPITVTHKLVDHPILRDMVQANPKLKQLKVGLQGTNFSATKEEYDELFRLALRSSGRKYWLYAPGDAASLWDEFYNEGIMALGWNILGDLQQYSSKDDLEAVLKEKTGKKNPYNDSLANWEFLDTMKIGDIIIPKQGVKKYLGYGVVASDYYYDADDVRMKSKRKVDWKKRGSWDAPNHSISTKTLTDITKYPDYVEKLIKLIGIETDEPTPNESKMDLNTIYYGPPGCGKTWKLQNEIMPKFIERNIRTEEEFHQSMADELSWWEVISVVLLDLGPSKVPAIYDHPLLQAKAQISSTKTPKNTIWSMLQIHTKDDCPNVNFTNRAYPQFFWKNENAVWEIDRQIVEEETPYLLERLNAYRNFDPNDGTELKRYVFTTFHQSFAYEDFVEGIKPDLEEATDGQISYKIVPGIFKKAVERAKADPDHDYAIFIDEINRGNIAAIFGELITLIEKDKRTGGRYPLAAKLPYSKEDFSVPSNLYIFGTMNTADRSVEALDSALRRRFTFEEVKPDPSLIVQPAGFSVDLQELLRTINKRIEVLLDKDHMIGHSYFMDIHEDADPEWALKSAFANKVVPLLEEYFYGDLSKIALILGGAFVIKDEALSDDVFAPGDFDRPEISEKAKYRLADIWDLSLDDFNSIYAKR